MYAQLSQERIRLVLGALDVQLQQDRVKGEQASFDYDRLQIEHLMPRSWDTHWPVSETDLAQRELAEQKRRGTVDRIGNLTLLAAPLNASVSNGPWDRKREALREHSQLVLNALVVDLDSWDEGAIEARARMLADVACREWAKPD
jgi:hypothetical protein